MVARQPVPVFSTAATDHDGMIGRTPDWSSTSAASMPWRLNENRSIERELVGPLDLPVGVAHEHEYVTKRARLLGLTPCVVPRAHTESVDVVGSGVRANDLFRNLILDYRPLRVPIEVGDRDRSPVPLYRRKVPVLRHEVISLKGSGDRTFAVKGAPRSMAKKIMIDPARPLRRVVRREIQHHTHEEK